MKWKLYLAIYIKGKKSTHELKRNALRKKKDEKEIFEFWKKDEKLICMNKVEKT